MRWRVQQARRVRPMPLIARLLVLFADQITSAEQLGNSKCGHLEVASFSAHDDVEDAVARRASAARPAGPVVPTPRRVCVVVVAIRAADVWAAISPANRKRVENLGFSIFDSRLYLLCLDELAHGRRRSQP